MRFTQLFAAAIACLAVASCSNNNSVLDDVNVKGQSQALSIHISNYAPLTKAVGSATEGADKLQLSVNKIEINLTAATGGTNGWLTVYEGQDKTTEQFESTNGLVTLFDVKEPSNLKVRINHTKAEKSANTFSNINDFQVSKAASMPAYGVTTSFNENTKTITNKTSSKVYEVIGAKVEVKIPTARIELSNINLKESKKFTALNLKNIFVNNAYTRAEASNVSSTFTYNNKISVLADNDITNLPHDIVNLSVLNNLELANKTYAYSVFPTNDENDFPKITFQFDRVKLNTGSNQSDRFAVITKLGNVKNIEAGKIYRIKNVSLNDDIIGVDINGNNLYAVEVEVIIPKFEFVDIEDLGWN